ncbi:uncharacterized protein C12orf56 homolog [Chanos chanos]|uniref:Uncharacterized protein C12orf56 homolog n=1 Tax=Chanos chanos TaxID=29144 RepID=A0A6J2V7Y2_CHACN|nr:uncharacterized protein C12orf56 homolog [Chanos chanos]
MPGFVARTNAEGLLCRRNSKLDSFLKRNTDGDVYERIRAYEPCVVISETVNKVFMHVILSDDCIYLTEYPPRTVQPAVCFQDIIDIELINDLPDFLSGRERERSQHIRVLHAAIKHTRKKGARPVKERNARPQQPVSPAVQHKHGIAPSLEGISSVLLSTISAPPEATGWRISPLSESGSKDNDEEENSVIRKHRSASCPNSEALGLNVLQSAPRHAPRKLSSSLAVSPLPCLSPRQVGQRPVSKIHPTSLKPASHQSSILAWLMRRVAVEKRREGEDEVKEEREAELHLYAVSPSSHIYLHLQSSWNSYIIRSTLMLDPLYVRRCSLSLSSPQKHRPPKVSQERTAHLFSQLSGELLQEGISLESLYLLLQELYTATHRNPTIKKFFWRSGDLCPFLVMTLADTMQETQSGVHISDRLLLCTLVVQTLSVMFRETEIEPARLSILTAKKGALTAKLLLALVCDPGLPVPDPHESPTDSSTLGQGSPLQTELETLRAEYLDAASALLFEVIVFCQEASRTPTLGHFLTVSWALKTLKPHPSLVPFVGYQAQQVVLALSQCQSPLSPSQAVLLYQRCRLLLACLQHSTYLSQYIRAEFREEFRYYVKMSELEEKLPLHYPISQPALRLLSQLFSVVLHRV